MNKNGQVLILFIIIIPIIIIIAAVLIDNGKILKEKRHLKNITKMVIKESFNKNITDEEELKQIFKENNIPIDNIKINISEEKITIKNNYKIDSIFGTIIGIKHYPIKININGIKEDNKINYE